MSQPREQPVPESRSESAESQDTSGMEDLREQCRRYTDLFEQAPMAYLVLDHDGVIEEINLAGARLLGGDRSARAGEPMISYIVPADRARFLEHIHRCRLHQASVFSEWRIRCADSTLKPVQVTSVVASRWKGRDAREGYFTALVDLSVHKAAEAQVRAGAERLQTAQAAGGVGLWEYRPDTGQLTWSEEKSHLFGLEHRPENVSYETWKSLIHPQDRERIATQLEGRLLECVDVEYRIIRPDGQVRWISSRGRALDDASPRMIGITFDITESKQIQGRLEELNAALVARSREAEASNAQLRALAAQLTQVENRERRRLALLLHDHLQQLLIAMRMKISLVKHQPRSENSEKLLVQSVNLLDEAIAASRSLSVELSPPMLYDSGLTAALEWLAEQMHDKHGLIVHVETTDEPEDEDIRVFLFQCVRELLLNVVKHAQSRRADVNMGRLADEQIRIVVRDYGRGFDPNSLSATRESFGLLSIRERLQWLGGQFEIRSNPGDGTEVLMIAPVRKPRSSQAPEQMEQWLSELPKSAGAADGQAAAARSIRVLVVDDHTVVRHGLTSLLESEPDLSIVGQAPDGQAAVDCVSTLPVDVVIMDFSMPGMNGAEATRRIREIRPDLPVIGMSVYEEQSIADSMRRAGAAAFFRKDDPSERLVATIRSLCPADVRNP